MTGPVTYNINLDDGRHTIVITPVNQHTPGGGLYATGVFKLSERGVGMGDIVFDDNMNEWEYTGIGGLTHTKAEEIANFIRNYKDTDTVD